MKHAALLALLTFAAVPVFGHCDALNGPVVLTAQQALDKSDVTAVLKWVRPQDESEIRRAFAQTVQVRSESPAAKALADRWFFETLVRIHREGEGAPFTGLKGEDFKVDEGISLADQSIETSSLEAAEKALLAVVSSGLRERYAQVMKAREHADHNVDAGRQYVRAYVEFIHYTERLHQAATTSAAHAATAETHAGH